MSITKESIKKANQERLDKIKAQNVATDISCREAFIKRLTTFNKITPESFRGSENIVISAPFYEEGRGLVRIWNLKRKCLYEEDLSGRYCYSQANPVKDMDIIQKKVTKFYEEKGLDISPIKINETYQYTSLRSWGNAWYVEDTCSLHNKRQCSKFGIEDCELVRYVYFTVKPKV